MFLISPRPKAKANLKLLKLRILYTLFLLGLSGCTGQEPQNLKSHSNPILENLEPLPAENPESRIAPNFELYDLNAKAFRLYELLEGGNYVLLNFWATWCPPCIEELPSMEELNRRWKGRLFTLVAVSVDDHPDEVRSFLEQLQPRKPSFLILHDPGKLVTTGLYGSEKFPETYLIGPDKKILKKFVGPRNWTDPAVLGEMEALLHIKAQ